jgi:hypothetical protein
MKLNAPQTQHAACAGGTAALVHWRFSLARTSGNRSHCVKLNLLPQIPARI